MVSYIENMYKKPPEEINENLQLTAATAELPLWKIYSEEENYVMPYLIDKSIGMFSFLFFFTIQLNLPTINSLLNSLGLGIIQQIDTKLFEKIFNLKPFLIFSITYE